MERYQRSVAAQAVKTSKDEANNMFKLADRLREFSNRAHAREDQAAAIEGEQAGMTAASGEIGGLDLSDNSTIRSRAFNKGAKLSHAAQIKIDINENINRIFQENTHDMEGFKTAVAGYKKGLLSEVDGSLRPLAEADINAATSNGTIKIGDTLFKQGRQEQIASIKKAVLVSEELTLQLSSNGDIEGADAQIEQIKIAIQEGIDQNLPGIDQAYLDSYLAKLTEKADSELILGVFKRELEENGIDAAETALKAFDQYTEPLIDDEGGEVSIEPGTKRSIVSSMTTLINREKALLRTEESAANALKTAEKKVLSDQVTQHISALDLNQFPETLDDLKNALVGFPDLQLKLSRAESEAAAAAVFMTQNPAQMEGIINNLNAKKDLSPGKAKLLERMKSIYADTTSRMESDIMGLAVEQGIIGELPLISFGSHPEQIKDRILQYRTAQAHYGTEVGSPLTQGEIKTLTDSLKDTEVSASSKMLMLSNLVEGFGPAATDLFENMFDKAAPEYTMVGELLNESRASGNASLLAVGENILLGMEAMEKGLVEIDSDLKGEILIALGNAAEGNPDYEQMVVESAMALYVNEHRGNSSDLPDMEDEINKFLTQLTGGILEINGRKFIAPKRNIDEGMFEKRIEELTRNDLNAGGGVHSSYESVAEALEMVQKDGQFVSSGQGKYLIVIDDGPPTEYLKDKNFKSFVFNYDTKAGISSSWAEGVTKDDIIDYSKVKVEEEKEEKDEVVEIEEVVNDQMIVSVFESEESAKKSRIDFEATTFSYDDGRIYTGTINMKDGVPYDGLGRKLNMKQVK